ncbi:MAG: nitrogenase component 1 [Elusimicrobiota bacterium]
MPVKAANSRKAPADLNLDPKLQESDETFWQQQEGRMTRQIGQPCCTLSGMTHLLIEMPGNFAVVLHSERDCANCFLNTHGVSGRNFYSVGITQPQFSSGRMGEPLRRCLELVIRHRKPDAVFVLGSCLVEMVYDTFDMVCAETAKTTGTPVIALRTSGLRHGSQAAMVDWLYSTLAGLAASRTSAVPEGKKGLSKRLNLIGMPHLNSEPVRRELTGFLHAAGLAINGVYPYEAGFEDWLKVGRASANVVVDSSLYPKLLAALGALKMTSVEVPLPVGIESTSRFFAVIGKQFGVAKSLSGACAAAVETAQRRLAAFRKRFGGLKVAVGLRMVNNYRVDQLAYDGLGDIATFVEAGFEVRLFIQGPGDRKSRRHFADRLKQLGCALPFEIFPDPYDLPPLLQADRPDVAYLADHARWETTKIGIPLIQSRSLEPLYSGAVRNFDYFDKVLTQIGRSRRGRR